jgi:GT2 family glycosyltransferase
MSKVFILTLSWNGCDKLIKLHQSLIPALGNISYTWLIRDNASNDNTVEIVKDWQNDALGSNIKLIVYKDNRQNFATGMNHLFTEVSPADNDYVMLLNNDVIFNDTTSINNMLDILRKDPTVGAVGARLLYTGTDKLQHAGVVFDKTYKTPVHFRVGQTSDADAEKNRLFQVVTGAVLITKADYYRKAFTNKSGAPGMDENYHWAFDDVDLCLSIKYNMNKKIVYCGNTNIWHEESATLKKNPANKLFLTHNLQYLFSKWKDRYAIDRDIYTSDPRHNLYRG